MSLVWISTLRSSTSIGENAISDDATARTDRGLFADREVRLIMFVRFIDVRAVGVVRRTVEAGVVERRELVDVLGSNDCSVPINVDVLGTPMNVLFPKV